MPTYEYACVECETTKTDVRSITAPEPDIFCEKCGYKMQKLLSLNAINFKGSGFYSKDK